MGITKADLDAQRAMLQRGEEKRKADWKQAERERLRDTFAAAALTGLLSNIPRYQLGVIAVQAYDIADEMLRERLRNGAADGRETVQSDRPSGVSSAWAEAANQQLRERGYYGSSPRSTNHDAVPAAKAGSDEARTDKAATSHRRDGTGNTPSEAEIDALEFVVEEGRTASVDDYGILRSWLIRLRPEWESQSYEESGEKRVNTTTSRGTLTDEEREAVEWFATFGNSHLAPLSNNWIGCAATLRNLLDRLK